MSHYIEFIQRWKTADAFYLFIFKNQAQILHYFPELFLNSRSSALSDQKPLIWSGDGLLPFQSDVMVPLHRALFFEIFYALVAKQKRTGAFFITWEGLLQRVPPISYGLDRSLFLSVGDKIDKTAWEKVYREGGYTQAHARLEPRTFFKAGESCSLRLPEPSNRQIKIEWFGEIIEHLWEKASDEGEWKEVFQVKIVPKYDFPIDDASQCRLLKWFSSHPVYQQLKTSRPLKLPKFLGPWRTILWGGSSSILDWLPQETRVIFLDDPAQGLETFWHFLAKEDEQALQDSRWPRPALTHRWLPAAELFSHPLMKNAEISPILTIAPQIESLKQLLSQGEDLQLWFDQQSFSLADWPIFLNNHSCKNFSWIFISSSSESQEAFKELMGNQHYEEIGAEQLQQKLRHQSLGRGIYHLFSPHFKELPSGRINLARSLIVVNEEMWRNTFPAAFSASIHPSLEASCSSQPTSNQFIENLIDLIPFQPNDYIAHKKYGIGRFLGLEEMTIRGKEVEFCVLEYAESAKIYVPVFALDKVHPYASSTQENVELTVLGSKRWENAKHVAQEKAKDVAFLLLKQSAEKHKVSGVSTPRNILEEQRFAQQCGFVETPDQRNAIEAVLNDLASTKIMDRLICGEVGFGKTEVALRAAFSVVSQKKQVMLLAPTTLLAQQHFDRFKKRFAPFSCRIECLSRFCSPKKAQEIMQRAAKSEIDIVIGTHRLLNKALKFKNLGLFILDEEHRFGVLQKEIVASLTHQVDRLTLTATPIPRTLSMAMHGLKDLSLIITPPSHRQPVKTIIGAMNLPECFLAVRRELEKGGQVYYVNNCIELHPQLVERFQKEFPEARIASVHGKLPVKELESRMLDYYHGNIDLLVCSVIIETGIDVPNANTLIVENADQFGLAQLHQLRGRVGRSQRQAYAYLYYSKSLLGKAAQKRLEALAQFSGLGAGFMLAEQDLEIRGAGDLLGHAQSGKGGQVGIGLYLELVTQAVNDLQSMASPLLPAHQRCEIDVGEELILSKKDIESVGERLKWYRRFALITDEESFEALSAKLVHQFGPLSALSTRFLEAVRLRVMAAAMGIESIMYRSTKAELKFHPASKKIQNQLQLFLNHRAPSGVKLSLFEGPTIIWTHSIAPSYAQKVSLLFRFISDFTQFLKSNKQK